MTQDQKSENKAADRTVIAIVAFLVVFFAIAAGVWAYGAWKQEKAVDESVDSMWHSIMDDQR